jgi:L-galactose dehydrogenase
MPRRSFGTRVDSKKLPSSVSIVGLGCSSFSTFFWTDQELQDDARTAFTSTSGTSIATSQWTSTTTPNNDTDNTDDSLLMVPKNHPRVQEWIQTILYAVNDAGITLLDTAPWYGHGSSEMVVGWALEEIFRPDDDNNSNDNDTVTLTGVTRDDLIINTKIGRYEADPNRQFDFSRAATLASVQRSLDRMKCGYIDVLQLHDPEFAPSLDQLLNETIPAMMECRDKGWCRALGLTGYSCQVQYQIFQRSLELYGGGGGGGASPSNTVWDQSLTYGHFNLHDTSLVTAPAAEYSSYADFCEKSKLLLIAAAPLSMGLLTGNAPPAWHPAGEQLQEACRDATEICTAHGVQISTLALCVALTDPRIPCTILGMKNVGEVQAVASVAQRVRSVDLYESSSLTPDEMVQQILTSPEQDAWDILRDPLNGPFATVWSNGSFQWDGLQGVREFWKQIDDRTNVEEWQSSDYSS